MIKEENSELLIRQTGQLIDWAVDNFGDRVFMTTAMGANGVVLIDIIKKLNHDIPIYFIDTSYHFEETIKIKEYYKDQGFSILEIRSDDIDRKKALYTQGYDVCCNINKVEPMKNLLSKKVYHLWISAISRSQTESRRNTPFLEITKNNVFKLSPLINWGEMDVWFYIREYNIEYNTLYDKGYKSIGCAPCTSKTKPGEDSRAGRWRDSEKEECGIHTKL